MNVNHISALSNLLGKVGFDQMEISLAKRICFRLPTFELQQVIQKNSNTVFFNFHFQRDSETGDYSLQYYDVMLQKELVIPSTVISSVDIRTLETKMSSIDWKNFTSAETNGSTDNKPLWETATVIDNICEQLSAISMLEEGRLIASRLKLKYWSGNLPDAITESIVTVKSKSDISQRFYFSPDNIISIDEAYRFLQNKWIEKQLQQKVRNSNQTGTTVDQGDPKKKEKTTQGLTRKNLLQHDVAKHG